MLPNYVLWATALCLTVHKLILLYMKYACQCVVVIKAAFEANIVNISINSSTSRAGVLKAQKKDIFSRHRF